ncbi:hypothetical protein [Salinicola endophyticus]|uniref:hypothetical protein n=1 Tax=Salinicola endophyticus TaxID=1949083 RepID=UPI000DA1B12B|nr:hypothetical protein [Salinicola endophyticus]
MKLASLLTEERRQAAKKAARKTMKGSVAFTSALLCGTNESQGLLRTLGQASAEAGKKVWDALPERNYEEERRRENEYGYRYGNEGYGYYMNGYKVED